MYNGNNKKGYNMKEYAIANEPDQESIKSKKKFNLKD